MVELWACKRCQPMDLQRRSASESWTSPRPAPDQTRPDPGSPPQVLKDSWGLGRIRTGCSRPPRGADTQLTALRP